MWMWIYDWDHGFRRYRIFTISADISCLLRFMKILDPITFSQFFQNFVHFLECKRPPHVTVNPKIVAVNQQSCCNARNKLFYLLL